MALHISLAEREELSGEIYRQIRRTIVEGVLRPNDQLPPSRQLAEELNVARTTVVVAYERLAAEGFVESRQGAGTFVARWLSPPPRSTSATDSGPLQPREIWEHIPLPTAFDQPALFDFRTGMPDASLFPHRHWRRLIARALRAAEMRPEPRYAAVAGHAGLRSAIARHLGISRGISALADEVIVTNGTQQAIDILARVLLSPGDRIAVEDPGYEAPRRAFEAAGATVIGVPVDQEGLLADALPEGVKAVYVTPSHQYPLTVTMSLARRRALLAWADRQGAAIIEDDYDGEFRFEGRPFEPIRTLDRGGRVIYVGSFSKTMLPSLRLGFMLVPSTLHAAALKAKYVSDWHTSTLEQAALAEFIEDGSFARHIRKLSLAYRARHRLIAQTIRRDFAEHLELIDSTSGLHVAARARSTSVPEMSEIAARAAADGVQVQRLSSFAATLPPQPGLVLGYGAISLSEIEEGLRRLRRCFETGTARTAPSDG